MDHDHLAGLRDLRQGKLAFRCELVEWAVAGAARGGGSLQVVAAAVAAAIRVVLQDDDDGFSGDAELRSRTAAVMRVLHLCRDLSLPSGRRRHHLGDAWADVRGCPSKEELAAGCRVQFAAHGARHKVFEGAGGGLQLRRR